jgi:hypothetical protein
LFVEAATTHALQQQYQIISALLCSSRHACFMLPVKGISAPLHPPVQPAFAAFSADLLLLQLQHRKIISFFIVFFFQRRAEGRH